MGIITKLTFKQLESHLQSRYAIRLISFTPTQNGVSDSVYLLDTDKGALTLKLFESATFEQVAAERELLNSLDSLPVAKVFSDASTFCGKPCALYETAKGGHLNIPVSSHVEQIGNLLSAMHSVTQNIKSENPSFAYICALKKELCKDTPFEPFADLFDEMAGLPTHGVIHGDLFADNIFFDDGKISCVIDFIEAFEGSFAFELGVVAFAFGIEHIPTLTASYGGYDENIILRHAVYAALFYGVGRYRKGGDFAECLSFLQTHS